MLRGAITALVTPMDNKGNIDYNSLTNLVELQIQQHITALVIGGATGEGISLSIDEKISLIKHVIEVNRRRVPLIVSSCLANTEVSCEFISQLNKIEAVDYVLIGCPYYVRPTQEGLYQHFAKIANTSLKPVILYNVPSRTSCDLEDDTVLKLANNFNNIIGLKDATGNIARASYLVKHKPKGFAIYSGDDLTSLAFMLCGGDGVISIISNILPNKYSQMCSLAIRGEKAPSISLNNEIMDLSSLMCIEANPIPVKWVLFKLGIITTPNLRLPLTTLSEERQIILQQILNNLNIN